MSRLVRAEWRKLFTTRMWIALVAAAAGFTALNAVALAVLAGVDLEGQVLPPLTDPAAMAQVYSAAGSASVIALLSGVLAMTAEFRHGTITSTYLATPARGAVLSAKMLAQAVIGLALGALCWATALLSLLVVLLFRAHAGLDFAQIGRVGAAVTLSFALYAVLGVGVGALLRNQIAAVAAALLWVMLVEALVVSLLPAVGRWLPGGALNGMLQTQSFTGADYLAPPAAAVLLLVWAGVFGAAAWLLALRRDVA